MHDVNNIPKTLHYVMGETRYRVTVYEEVSGKTIYSKESVAGQLCTVEDVLHVNYEKGEVNGNQQHFAWGHPALVVHAYLQAHRNVKQLLQNHPEYRKEVEQFFNINKINNEL